MQKQRKQKGWRFRCCSLYFRPPLFHSKVSSTVWSMHGDGPTSQKLFLGRTCLWWHTTTRPSLMSHGRAIPDGRYVGDHCAAACCSGLMKTNCTLLYLMTVQTETQSVLIFLHQRKSRTKWWWKLQGNPDPQDFFFSSIKQGHSGNLVAYILDYMWD